MLLNKEAPNTGENLPETGDPNTPYIGLLDVTCLPWINLSFCFRFFFLLAWWDRSVGKGTCHKAQLTESNPLIYMVLWPPHRHHGLCILPHTHTYTNIIFKTYCVRGHTCYGMCMEVKWHSVELNFSFQLYAGSTDWTQVTCRQGKPLSPEPSCQSQSSQLQNKTRNGGAHLQSQHSGRPRQEGSKVKPAWAI